LLEKQDRFLAGFLVKRRAIKYANPAGGLVNNFHPVVAVTSAHEGCVFICQVRVCERV
jgi:hypothetical protein